MITNTTYDCINTAYDCNRYWKRLIKEDEVIIKYDPIYEYTETLKDYYIYLAWANDTMTESDNY